MVQGKVVARHQELSTEGRTVISSSRKHLGNGHLNSVMRLVVWLSCHRMWVGFDGQPLTPQGEGWVRWGVPAPCASRDAPSHQRLRPCLSWGQPLLLTVWLAQAPWPEAYLLLCFSRDDFSSPPRRTLSGYLPLHVVVSCRVLFTLPWIVLPLRFYTCAEKKGAHLRKI